MLFYLELNLGKSVFTPAKINVLALISWSQSVQSNPCQTILSRTNPYLDCLTPTTGRFWTTPNTKRLFQLPTALAEVDTITSPFTNSGEVYCKQLHEDPTFKGDANNIGMGYVYIFE